MRIRRLEVEGFRSLKNISWEPGALNVVIGPNGSGKSNLLQVLWLLQRAANGELQNSISLLGGQPSVFWDNQANDIKFTIGFTTNFGHTGYAWRISLRRGALMGEYGIENESLYCTENNETTELLEQERQNLKSGIQNHSITKGIDINYESIFQIYKNPFMLNPKVPFAWWAINRIVVFRQINTDISSPLRQAAITTYVTTLAPDGSNLIQVLHTLYTSDRNFEEDVDSAMRAAFGDEYVKLVFPPAADQRVQLRIRWKSLKREQSALDISDGTLRFLYLLAILANPDPSPLIAIDEPETGLHPSMFRIIAEFAQECSKKSQVIFTTHSPQFLDAFGDTPPTTTVAQWRNGETELKVLDGEELAVWLREYSLGQLFTSGELEGMA